MRIRLSGDFLAGAVSLLFLIGAWQAVTAAGLVSPHFLPSPLAVARRLLELFPTPLFLGHLAQTLIRLSAGFAIALVIGVALGLAASQSRAATALLQPLVRVLAPIPKIALYPALILTLGFDHASKVTLVAADAVFPILLATFHGARLVEPKLIWSARSAGCPQWRVPFSIVLPAALPVILVGCRIGLIIACIVVFLAEMISSSDGLGHLLVRAARSFQTVDMFVPLVLISLIGLLASRLIEALRTGLTQDSGRAT